MLVIENLNMTMIEFPQNPRSNLHKRVLSSIVFYHQDIDYVKVISICKIQENGEGSRVWQCRVNIAMKSPSYHLDLMIYIKHNGTEVTQNVSPIIKGSFGKRVMLVYAPYKPFLSNSLSLFEAFKLKSMIN